MTFPDGAQVKYQRNLLGEISSIHYIAPGGSPQTVVEAVQYVPFGAARGWRYGNGRLLHRRLDKNYRIRQIYDNQNGGLSLSYHYDGNSQLVKLLDHDDQPLAQYRYDGLGRLIAHLDGQGQLQRGYQYDATGNRIQVELPSGYWDYSYPAQSHRLSSVAGNRRNYLPGGQLAAREEDSWQYQYDAHGRLIGVSQHGFDVVSYGYNAHGEQIRREMAGNISLYMYDETGKLLGEYDYSGNPKQQIIWLDDYPVAVVSTRAGQWRLDYIEPDHLGTPRVIIDGQRNIPIWQWPLTGEAFGASMPDQDPDGDGIPFVFQLRYPGQRHDPATGLNYNYYRDYEPKTGRYIQSDPIGLEGGINTYAYAGGNPVSAIDSLGLETCLLTTVTSYGIRDHSAIFTSRGDGSGGPALYDPAGAYGAASGGGSSGLVVGDAASIRKFRKFHSAQKVESTCKNTTQKEEESIIVRAMELPSAAPFQCAVMSSAALSGHPSFPHVQAGTFWPGNLRRQFIKNP